jgi:hypothetical protein
VLAQNVDVVKPYAQRIMTCLVRVTSLHYNAHTTDRDVDITAAPEPQDTLTCRRLVALISQYLLAAFETLSTNTAFSDVVGPEHLTQVVSIASRLIGRVVGMSGQHTSIQNLRSRRVHLISRLEVVKSAKFKQDQAKARKEELDAKAAVEASKTKERKENEKKTAAETKEKQKKVKPLVYELKQIKKQDGEASIKVADVMKAGTLLFSDAKHTEIGPCLLSSTFQSDAVLIQCPLTTQNTQPEQPFFEFKASEDVVVCAVRRKGQHDSKPYWMRDDDTFKQIHSAYVNFKMTAKELAALSDADRMHLEQFLPNTVVLSMSRVFKAHEKITMKGPDGSNTNGYSVVVQPVRSIDALGEKLLAGSLQLGYIPFMQYSDQALVNESDEITPVSAYGVPCEQYANHFPSDGGRSGFGGIASKNNKVRECLYVLMCVRECQICSFTYVCICVHISACESVHPTQTCACDILCHRTNKNGNSVEIFPN